MTPSELKSSFLADAGMAAEDCKISADYAAYNFKNGNISEARRYVANLEANLQRLKGNLSMADRQDAKQ
jgi:hypothetical protein